MVSKKSKSHETLKPQFNRGRHAKERMGRSSVVQGRVFEDRVADLYRLLGAAVTQNVMICQKKVDLLAEFTVPGSSTKHRVIIECKNEARAVAQNQRVMEFAGLLTTARRAEQADSAEIITRVAWSDQAKGFAREAGVRILTYAEKVAQLIDLASYLRDTVKNFEDSDPSRSTEPPLGAYYVDMSAERTVGTTIERLPLVDTYLDEWLNSKSVPHLAILGEFGSGKSSLSLKNAHSLTKKYLEDPQYAKIPILHTLREFTKTLRIEALVSSFLDEECGVANPRFRLFRTMNDAGVFLLIFDGFDEMAVRVDADTLEANLLEIEKLASSPNSKVILTSRPEYFVSVDEQKRSLNPQVHVIKTREAEYEPITILPCDET